MRGEGKPECPLGHPTEARRVTQEEPAITLPRLQDGEETPGDKDRVAQGTHTRGRKRSAGQTPQGKEERHAPMQAQDVVV